MRYPFGIPKARILSLILCCALIAGILPVKAASAKPTIVLAPSVSAKSAFLLESDGGVCIYENNADARMGEASTTKIMTALVVAESLPLEQVISVCAEAVGTEGSSVYLTEGELLSVRELLLALLLESANDAAVALAVAVSGSVESFAALMNERAAALGLTDTHFTNPHGLYDEAHYTTARELAIITAEAFKNPSLREIFASKRAEIRLGASKENPDGEGKRYLYNHNKMLSLYEGAIGVKTGFTRATGRCLVSAAERDGMTLICVTLSAPDDWADHSSLLDYGFERYRRAELYGVGELCVPYAISGGKEQYVTAVNETPLTLTLPVDCDLESVRLTLDFPQRFELAPTEAGDLLGRVTLCFDGRQADSLLVAAYGVPSSERERKRLIFSD